MNITDLKMLMTINDECHSLFHDLNMRLTPGHNTILFISSNASRADHLMRTLAKNMGTAKINTTKREITYDGKKFLFRTLKDMNTTGLHYDIYYVGDELDSIIGKRDYNGA